MGFKLGAPELVATSDVKLRHENLAMWAVVLSAVAGGVIVAAVVALQSGFGVGSSHFSLGQTLFGEECDSAALAPIYE